MSRPMADTSKRRPRRQFTDGFKASAVCLVLDEGKTVGAAASGRSSPGSARSAGARTQREILKKAAAFFAKLLDRQFDAERPNQRWVGDTTEFVIGGNATLYLAAEH